MSHWAGNSCICSSCFVRNYSLYNFENRSVRVKKRGSLKPVKQATAEEVEIGFWKFYFYLQQLKNKHRTTKFPRSAKLTETGQEWEVVRNINASKVFLESPTNWDDRRQVMEVDPKTFWDFVYQQVWKGRIRVCEGELMYKITETLKSLVNRKKIANFTVARMFTARSAGEGNDTTRKESQSSELVVRVDQTFYGGVPRKAEKMVHFNLVPNSVFTPRLISLSPILKQDKNATQEAAQIKCPTFLPAVEAITSSAADKHEPALKRSVHSGQKREQVPTFRACATKDDFASMCLQATQDFIVTKELITNSRTLKSLTFFTLRRKDNLLENNKIAETMKSFYTSASLFDHSEDSPVLIPLLERGI